MDEVNFELNNEVIDIPESRPYPFQPEMKVSDETDFEVGDKLKSYTFQPTLKVNSILAMLRPEGEYVIGEGLQQVHLPLSKKPNFVHRFFCRTLLGWQWIDKI
jgi:hypothetical protein